MIKRLLIANRGEIACRIIQTAKKMGITAITIKSDAEHHPLHEQMADECYSVGNLPLQNSYLNQDKIIKLAQQINADAIHPGYGFLAENSDFVAKCEQNNMTFVGPSSQAIKLMGKKDDAKECLANANIPVVPGYNGQSQDPAFLKAEAEKIGLPVLLKAAAGGGGKGMRKVFAANQLLSEIEAAKREALNSFGDDKLIIEKYLTNVRHIEVQVVRDTHGNALHLFERDCSVQRRHQKIIEEAPIVTDIPSATREKMYQAATEITQVIDYHGVGTIEYLYSNGEFYFLEMNTRIQVEHPVTEMITGVDLVEWQIHIANGDSLPCGQSDLKIKGHSIEARVYAEDPLNGFLPTSGKLVDFIHPKTSQHIRIDTGVQSGDDIGIHFDPMIAKLTVWGQNRQEAIDRLKGCLHQCATFGLTTNIDFLSHLASHNDYVQGKIYTHTLDSHIEPYLFETHIPDNINCLMALIHMISSANKSTPWHTKPFYRMNHEFSHHLRLKNDHDELVIRLHKNENAWQVKSDVSSHEYQIHLTIHDNICSFSLDGMHSKTLFSTKNDTIWLLWEGRHYSARINPPKDTITKHKTDNAQLFSPMPGIIRQIFVSDKQSVKQGDKLIALEAMKMEHTLTASRDGTIKAIHYKIGDQVEQGKSLIQFDI